MLAEKTLQIFTKQAICTQGFLMCHGNQHQPRERSPGGRPLGTDF
jgi:hypothetical protein